MVKIKLTNILLMLLIILISYCGAVNSKIRKRNDEKPQPGQEVIKLFDDIALGYAERNDRYTRILKLGSRQGDCAELAFLELV